MAKVIRMIFMAPWALLYGSIIWVRNLLFDLQLFKSQYFKVPIICIGNLEMGGSGKTPMTDWLIEHLSQKYKIAYLSRGYQRKSEGFQMADHNATVENFGDEAFLIFKKWREKIVLAVDANRVRGISQLLENHPDIQVILLDDGMQHRWVMPKILIQLTPFAKPFFENQLFPMGSLRDQKKEYKRTDLLVFTKAPEASENLKIKLTNQLKSAGFPIKKTFVSRLIYLPAINLNGSLLSQKEPVVAVSGLANNQTFFDYVNHNFSVARSISKPDHYRYLPGFFADQNIENQTVLTTEKDFHKLVALAPNPELIFFIPIKIEIYPENLFIESIENQL
jgi:tetraacyldisaccharide 4'-kinase